MFNQPLKNVREHLTDECVKILTSYRRHCATSTAPGQVSVFQLNIFIYLKELYKK